MNLPKQYTVGINQLLAQSPVAQDQSTEQPWHWEPFKTVNGIEIARQLVKDDKLQKLRGVGEIAAPPSLVYDVVCNQSDKWDDGLKQFRTLSETQDPCGAEIETAYARYDIGGGPFVKDRDFIYTEVRMPLRSGVYVIFSHSIPEEEEAGFANSGLPSKGAVRGFMGDSGWVIAPTANGLSHVTYVVAADLRGGLPAWLVNKGSVDEVMAIDEVRKLAVKQHAA